MEFENSNREVRRKKCEKERKRVVSLSRTNFTRNRVYLRTQQRAHARYNNDTYGMLADDRKSSARQQREESPSERERDARVYIHIYVCMHLCAQSHSYANNAKRIQVNGRARIKTSDFAAFFSLYIPRVLAKERQKVLRPIRPIPSLVHITRG